jgi:hypothetical protein
VNVVLQTSQVQFKTKNCNQMDSLLAIILSCKPIVSIASSSVAASQDPSLESNSDNNLHRPDAWEDFEAGLTCQCGP